MTTSIPLNPTEREMIRVLLQGTKDDLLLLDHEKAEVLIELSMEEVKYLFDNLEYLIESQETDQGDWVRASEYRKAKGPLVDKLRPLVMQLLPNP